VHISSVANKTITLGPAAGSIGPSSTATNVSPLVVVQHSRSQSPIRTSGVGVPQPVFYSPPHTPNSPALQTKTLNERMMNLANMAGTNPTTAVRRSNVFEPAGSSGYNILPHELPMPDNKNIAGKNMTGGPQPTFNNLGVAGQMIAPPEIKSSRVLLPGGMQQTTTVTTTKQLVELGPNMVPGQTVTTSRLQTSQVGQMLPHLDSHVPETERRLVGPSGMAGPGMMTSQLPVQVNSGTAPQLPIVMGTEKKKGTCFSCCRCNIF
jgi:hypothetical protein